MSKLDLNQQDLFPIGWCVSCDRAECKRRRPGVECSDWTEKDSREFMARISCEQPESDRQAIRAGKAPSDPRKREENPRTRQTSLNTPEGDYANRLG